MTRSINIYGMMIKGDIYKAGFFRGMVVAHRKHKAHLES